MWYLISARTKLHTVSCYGVQYNKNKMKPVQNLPYFCAYLITHQHVN